MDFVSRLLANIRGTGGPGQPLAPPEATPNEEADRPTLDQVLAAGTPSLVEEGVFTPATPASADDDDDDDDELDDDDDDADDEDRPAALAVGRRVTRSASRAAEKEREAALIKLACEAVVDVDARDRVDRILGVIASCRDDEGRPAAGATSGCRGPSSASAAARAAGRGSSASAPRARAAGARPRPPRRGEVVAYFPSTSYFDAYFPPRPPVAPPHDLDAQPLQYGGTIQEAPVAAFGADAV
ncbi:1-alkyl-2-acetylglycerophosphocholine esterase [Aureococcus anophagefferens]|nr:1-alkyl-2-acetylglycerophosphocholine esterase [Aureococcus anophagefferens]